MFPNFNAYYVVTISYEIKLLTQIHTYRKYIVSNRKLHTLLTAYGFDSHHGRRLVLEYSKYS